MREMVVKLRKMVRKWSRSAMGVTLITIFVAAYS